MSTALRCREPAGHRYGFTRGTRERPGPDPGAATRNLKQGPQRAATKATVAALALTIAVTPIFTKAAATPAAAHPPTAAAAAGSLELWEQQRTQAAAAATRAHPPQPAPAITVAVKVYVAENPAPARKPPAAKPKPKPAATSAKPASGPVSKVTAFALDQVGKPYKFASAGPDSFDCSGLALAAYATVGIRLPHQTGGIITLGKPVPRSELAAGDLVFPSSGHVGIYIGGGQMVHAPKPGDRVKVADVYAFLTARRLL